MSLEAHRGTRQKKKGVGEKNQDARWQGHGNAVGLGRVGGD